MNYRRPRPSRRAAFLSAVEPLESRLLLTTYTVNALADAAAVNPASGDATSTLGVGQITLRSAIQAADATAGPNTIVLPAGTYPLTILLGPFNDPASGDLNITGSLTLIGAGAASTIISAQFPSTSLSDRVLSVDGPGTVAISGVTLTGGKTTRAQTNFGSGGGIHLKSANLTLTDSVVSGNSVNDYGGLGGGIFNDGGQLTLTRTTIASNTTSKVFGGQGGGGGGIFNTDLGVVNLVDSVVAGNRVNSVGGGTAGAGGGIDNFNGQLNLTRSTVRDNSAGADYGGVTPSTGGGIYTVGTTTLTDSTVSGNDAGQAGGIASYSVTLNLLDSTISGNTVRGRGAGILFTFALTGSSNTASSIDGSTIAGNSSTGPAGGGIALDGVPPVTIRNTILANNTGGSYVQAGATALTSLGHNLSTDATTATVLNAAGDQNSVDDAKLGPLADNGGATFTLALLPGSPAIGAGDPTNAPVTDQRGRSRVIGNGVDIGAFEVQSSTIGTVATTTTLSSSNSLSIAGQVVTFTAIVSSDATVVGSTTGDIVFSIDNVQQAGFGVDVVNGHAQAFYSPFPSLTAGDHTVVASFTGSTVYAPSVSSPVIQSVNVPTTTTLTASANPSTFGQVVTFTAVVANTAPRISTIGGLVFFFVDGKVAGTGPVTVVAGRGQATFATSTLAAGTHIVAAEFSAPSVYAESISAPLTQVVAISSATTLTASPTSLLAGQTVTLSATVTGSGGVVPTGPVTFKEGATTLGTAVLDAGGRAVLVVPSLAPGLHSFTAVYGGGSALASSTSNVVAEVVAPAAIVGDGPTVKSLQRFGYHERPTTLVIRFSGPLDPARARLLSNYRITGPAGPHSRRVIPIDSAVYDAASNTVTLRPHDLLKLRRHYQLQIVGTGSTGLADISGRLLDGAGTGRPGSDFARQFGREIFAGTASQQAEAAKARAKVSPAAFDRLATSGRLTAHISHE